MKKIFLLSLLVIFASCSSSELNEDDQLVTTVSISPNDEAFLSLSQEVQLQAEALNASGKAVETASIIWSSSDTNILSITSNGLITGLASGTATVTADAGDKSGDVEFRVVDLSGEWIGGEFPDTVKYSIIQTGNSVDGIFNSTLGFPPITDVNTGTLTGSLTFDRYDHALELTTEDNCVLRITGTHFVQLDEQGEIFLSPGSGFLGSTNCSFSGTIDFATLRRQ